MGFNLAFKGLKSFWLSAMWIWFQYSVFYSVTHWITPLLHGSSHVKAVKLSYSMLSITWKWNILQNGAFFQRQLYIFHVWSVKLIWPSIHSLISIQKAMKLCPYTETPNHLVWILLWRSKLPTSSDSFLKIQAVYSSETLLYSDHMLS